MRILDLIDTLHVKLTETTSENVDLLAISKYIADYLITYKPNKFVTLSDIAHYRALPDFKSGTVINLLFGHQTRFSLASPRKMNHMLAYYDKGDDDIVIDRRLTRFKPELIRTITHELQHALDNYKSSGKGLQSKTPADATTVAGYTEYLQRKHEVNARFSQALYDIISAESESLSTIGRIGTAKESMDVIKLALSENQLGPEVFANLQDGDKQYKRLLVRAYKFYDEVKHTIEVTPDEPKATLINAAKDLIKRYLFK